MPADDIYIGDEAKNRGSIQEGNPTNPLRQLKIARFPDVYPERSTSYPGESGQKRDSRKNRGPGR
jgi:hypothetical protein